MISCILWPVVSARAWAMSLSLKTYKSLATNSVADDKMSNTQIETKSESKVDTYTFISFLNFNLHLPDPPMIILFHRASWWRNEQKMIYHTNSLSCPPCTAHPVTVMSEIHFWLKFTISVKCRTSVGNHLNTSRMVFLAHNDVISVRTAWLRIRTGISSTIPVPIWLALKGWGTGLGLYIKMLRVSLYFCGLSWAHDFAVMN